MRRDPSRITLALTLTLTLTLSKAAGPESERGLPKGDGSPPRRELRGVPRQVRVAERRERRPADRVQAAAEGGGPTYYDTTYYGSTYYGYALPSSAPTLTTPCQGKVNPIGYEEEEQGGAPAWP
eukprot:scaffold129979_cov51-Phaeocystis_antarctica.AAC.3